MAHKLEGGSKWKELPDANCPGVCPGGHEFTVGECGPLGKNCGEGCGKNKDVCACICAPQMCLCHTMVPCCVVNGEQCYYAWACFNGQAGVGLIVTDEGKKMKIEWCFCCKCAEFEKVEDGPTYKTAGGPQSTEMQR